MQSSETEHGYCHTTTRGRSGSQGGQRVSYVPAPVTGERKSWTRTRQPDYYDKTPERWSGSQDGQRVSYVPAPVTGERKTRTRSGYYDTTARGQSGSQGDPAVSYVYVNPPHRASVAGEWKTQPDYYDDTTARRQSGSKGDPAVSYVYVNPPHRASVAGERKTWTSQSDYYDDTTARARPVPGRGPATAPFGHWQAQDQHTSSQPTSQRAAGPSREQPSRPGSSSSRRKVLPVMRPSEVLEPSNDPKPERPPPPAPDAPIYVPNTHSSYRRPCSIRGGAPEPQYWKQSGNGRGAWC